MTQPPIASWSRRRFLTRAGALVAASALTAPALSAHGSSGTAIPALSGLTTNQMSPAAPLLEGVVGTCTRLADAGWRDLLLAVSGGQLDIAAADLAASLAQPIPIIDRSLPGFEDFAMG